MRDRLIELLMSKSCKHNKCPDDVQCDDCEHLAVFDGDAEKIADAILADGWMRPPCKVGDVVYFVARNSGKPIGAIDEIEIVMIGKTEDGYCAKGKLGENTFDIIPHFEIDNYTFFNSKEEAKQALRKEDEGK